MTRPRPKTLKPPKRRRVRRAKPPALRSPEEQARREVLYLEIERRLAALAAERDAAANPAVSPYSPRFSRSR
jgi:hypothetical protein